MFNFAHAQTGGRAIILGKTGRNFAAGMSGGIAYVLDEGKTLEKLVNQELVTLFHVEPASDDSAFLRYGRQILCMCAMLGGFLLSVTWL